ncbi:MAG TPA: signal recognition particle receptor subunit alpha, partial [Nitriliruptoraceae bacterium]|nr:signal recognition particle receptor subunit alpha [Nitriliruptoraceae bacterium]
MEIEIILAISAVVLVVVTTLSGFLIRGRRGPDEPDRGGTAGDATTTTATRERPPTGDAGPDETGGDVAVAEPPTPTAPPRAPEPDTIPLGQRFRQRLARTRNVLGVQVAELFGRGVNDEAWEGLEETLIASDVGVTASLEVVDQVRTRAREEGVTDADGVVALLKDELRAVLDTGDRSLARAADDEPTVWMMTGVNGTGKTTTIGKLAAIESRAGNSVVLAAADTFRAAAAEQLGLWADRTDARLVRKDEGADPASVAYDGYMAARATDADVLIVDTAGRLHNRRELMDELGKVKRVVEKQSGPME